MLVRVTPLVYSALGWLKLESLQRTGSFKLRGAVAALEALRTSHVVAASAGNHGLGLACAGQALGARVTIVVPENAAMKKQAGIRDYGAELIVRGATYDDAERAARVLASERGVPFVSPFDDEAVIAGNGASLGRELMAQRPSLRRVVVPIGGGGLVSGLLDALPHVEVIGVQPRGAQAMTRSLSLGHALLTDDGPTICSGLDGGVSERTFQRARARDLRIVVVEEADVMPAVGYAYSTLGIVVEPAAAVVIAAARRGLFPIDDATALIITGSNIDDDVLGRAIAASLRHEA